MMIWSILIGISWWLSGFFWTLYEWHNEGLVDSTDVLGAMMLGILGPILIIASGIAYIANYEWKSGRGL